MPIKLRYSPGPKQRVDSRPKKQRLPVLDFVAVRGVEFGPAARRLVMIPPRILGFPIVARLHEIVVELSVPVIGKSLLHRAPLDQIDARHIHDATGHFKKVRIGNAYEVARPDNGFDMIVIPSGFGRPSIKSRNHEWRRLDQPVRSEHGPRRRNHRDVAGNRCQVLEGSILRQHQKFIRVKAGDPVEFVPKSPDRPLEAPDLISRSGHGPVDDPNIAFGGANTIQNLSGFVGSTRCPAGSRCRTRWRNGRLPTRRCAFRRSSRGTPRRFSC